MNTKFCAIATVLATGAIAMSALQPVSAQTGASDSRVYVELKDASLYDALEMVYKAAGNPSHVIDPSAKAINVGNALFQNQQWSEIVLTLARQNNFRVRNESGTYFVEPRPTFNQGGFPGEFPGGQQGGRGRNPFGGMTGFSRSVSPSMATVPNATTSNAVAVPATTTRVSPQTLPGRRGGGFGNNIVTSGGSFFIEPLQSTYAGAIASLFEGATVVTTQDWVIPQVYFEAIFGPLVEREGTPSLDFDADTTSNSSSAGGRS